MATTRENLITTLNASLTDRDKNFLLSVKDVQPDWSIYDFKRFPSINWKLQNLQKLKDNNPSKHSEQYKKLTETLNFAR
jgi:hypothetical protein